MKFSKYRPLRRGFLSSAAELMPARKHAEPESNQKYFDCLYALSFLAVYPFNSYKRFVSFNKLIYLLTFVLVSPQALESSSCTDSQPVACASASIKRRKC